MHFPYNGIVHHVLDKENFMSQVSSIQQGGDDGRRIDLLSGSVKKEESAPSFPDVCHMMKDGMCRLDGKKCGKCTTAEEVVERATGAPEIKEDSLIAAASGSGASFMPPSLPPRLPLLEGERVKSDLLSTRSERFFAQLKEFETQFRGLLRFPLKLSHTLIREHYARFETQLAHVERLNSTRSRLILALDEHRASSKMEALTPKQAEALVTCKETVVRLARTSQFLVNYLETIIASLDRREAPTLLELHAKTGELALRILTGSELSSGEIISKTAARKVQIITYGDEFSMVRKSVSLPETGILDAQVRALRFLKNEVQKLIALSEAPHVIPHYFARITTRAGILYLERAEYDFQHLIFRRGITKTRLHTLIRDALIGISETHKRKIIHNDIKLENILIQGDQAYLSDFGLAQFEGVPCIGGTKFYAAPERLYKTGDTTRKSDIWSFGILCFVALTGSYPITKEVIDACTVLSSQSTIDAHIQAELAKATSRTSALDPDGHLQEVIIQCLKHNKDERPTAEELLALPFFNPE